MLKLEFTRDHAVARRWRAVAEDVAILISIAQCQQRTILSNVSKVSKSAACVPNIWVVFDLSIKI